MMTLRILIPAIYISFSATAQNLVINPGAEANPRGTGWTMVSAGPTACGVAPSNTFLNWTMIPDGSGNYPAAHGGTRTFYSGCSVTAPAGPFEIYQDINVAADAALIDAGNLTTSFSGFIQTPIATQTDAGRFIVDFMTATNTVLGTSYTTPFQSNAGGSGTGWVNYSNTRIAPVGTRKIRVRLQTMVGVTPAINAYFDDISLTTASTLPLTLISFKGQTGAGYNLLNWSTAEEINTAYFSVERWIISEEWNEIARIDAAGNSNTTLHYNFRDPSPLGDMNYYRLKMVDIDGSFTFSHTLKLSSIDDVQPVVKIFPNPSAGWLMIRTSFAKPFELKIVSNTGQLMRQQQLAAGNNHSIDIRSLSPGLYILQLTDKAGNTRNFSLLRQ